MSDITPDGNRHESTRPRTISDIARLAGVHAGTVSRALADNPLVNAETRARIQALADEHGFRPNQMASRLRTQKTHVVGVVVPLGHERRQHLSDPFFMTILGHLADALTEGGYDIMLSRVIPDAHDWLERIVDSGMLDGVLLIGQSDQFDAIERVAARYRPLVVWGDHVDGQHHCAVGVDNRLGGLLAGRRLIERGCRQLAFFGEIRTLELAHRYDGLIQAAREADIADPVQCDTHLASDVMAAEISDHLDRLSGRIDGIAAASDVIAMRSVRVLADRGIAVPGDVPVVGFDDLPLASQIIPRLTTIRQDVERGAAEMIRALFARMQGAEMPGADAPSVIMTPELVVRDSA
ncbi:LacI family transcriptional regulator [Sphingomonas sp. Leaf17]|uniref:LacI family DNA-binding transcriptional regulator n=1 Tax=Sphingomonas sp. Leaf17 TaxID=1735683 RepID=UPI0006F9854D|nr:LacI family DNA-binding transcriptional regulator [Sphingomonas sp. Leaf17]KQM67682.1 LacI family transcriptional regulator [Sphingomonas sp. Leaf17]